MMRGARPTLSPRLPWQLAQLCSNNSKPFGAPLWALAKFASVAPRGVLAQANKADETTLTQPARAATASLRMEPVAAGGASRPTAQICARHACRFDFNSCNFDLVLVGAGRSLHGLYSEYNSVSATG